MGLKCSGKKCNCLKFAFPRDIVDKGSRHVYACDPLFHAPITELLIHKLVYGDAMYTNYGDEPERVCELECQGLKGLPARHEFVGPVKIILIESTPMDYRRKVCWSAMFALALLFMGVAIFTVILYTMAFKLPFWMNLHIVVCTIGLQLFNSMGILMYSTLFGGALFLNQSSRKFQHFLLQAASVICGIAGTIMVMTSMTCSLHALSGLLGVLFAVFAAVLGPGAYFSSSSRAFGRFNRKMHMLFALPSFIFCTVCFAMVFLETKFMKWLDAMGDEEDLQNARLGSLNLLNVVDYDHQRSYCIGVLISVFAGLSHILIGAVNITVIMYSHRTTDCHSAYFTIAYNFFAAEAILSLSFVNGWATPMRFKHRRYVHIFLQLFTIIVATGGVIIMARNLEMQGTMHSVTGLLTLLLTVLSSLTGPFALKAPIRKGPFVHLLCGIPCFCSSAICLCTGLLKQDFKRWAGKHVVYMLNIFIIFYTTLIVITTLMKCVNKS
ncbi:hypothetical protein HW555_013823 [Spodoptera exigua]|uniref:ascorbate ferrireductase (transmembrane) n=1 Tax=Spodoptera exigua TaxID=7107 RepID=A0A835KWL3_SPOEX|nr:hypothetical protein HW555_013823 [Spodoptera exigua]